MKAIVVGVGMAIGVCAAAVGAEAFSASYDQTVTQGRRVTNSTVSMKGTMFRMDATVNGQASVILRNDKGTFTYMPSENMAMKLPNRDPSQGPVEHADNYAQYLRERKAERIGAETIDGHPCEIYRFIEPETEIPVTAWVWTAKQFPIRLEYDDKKGKMLVEIRNLQVGNAIPDSTFQLPANVQVMDMGNMMSGMKW